MNRNRQEKGITLIALVITIIVLLILAGVTISLILGDEGIFKLASQSVEKQKMAEYQEKIELSRSKALANNNGTITIDDLINQIYEDKIVQEGNIKKVDEEKAQLITSEGHEFIITTTNTEYIGNINDVTTIKVTKEIKGKDGDYINILVTIEDEEHGICEIVKPDGLVIAGNNKTKIAIDYKVEQGKDYIFKITNGEGKIKNAVINVDVNWNLVYLFKDGNEYTELTGGFGFQGFPHAYNPNYYPEGFSQAGAFDINKNDGLLAIKTYANGYGFHCRTKKAIDFGEGKYLTLVIKYKELYARPGNSAFGVKGTPLGSWVAWKLPDNAELYHELDVSNVTGNGYVMFQCASGEKMVVSEIYLIKK